MILSEEDGKCLSTQDSPYYGDGTTDGERNSISMPKYWAFVTCDATDPGQLIVRINFKNSE